MASGTRYGITLKQLRELMEFRGREGVEKIKEYGGVHEIAKKLQTSEKSGKNNLFCFFLLNSRDLNTGDNITGLLLHI